MRAVSPNASACRPASSSDTLGGLYLPRATGFDWRPPHGRVLWAGDRVVLATTRQGLDILMTGVQAHRTPPAPPGTEANQEPA